MLENNESWMIMLKNNDLLMFDFILYIPSTIFQ